MALAMHCKVFGQRFTVDLQSPLGRSQEMELFHFFQRLKRETEAELRVIRDARRLPVTRAHIHQLIHEAMMTSDPAKYRHSNSAWDDLPLLEDFQIVTMVCESDVFKPVAQEAILPCPSLGADSDEKETESEEDSSAVHSDVDFVPPSLLPDSPLLENLDAPDFFAPTEDPSKGYNCNDPEYSHEEFSECIDVPEEINDKETDTDETANEENEKELDVEEDTCPVQDVSFKNMLNGMLEQQVLADVPPKPPPAKENLNYWIHKEELFPLEDKKKVSGVEEGFRNLLSNFVLNPPAHAMQQDVDEEGNVVCKELCQSYLKVGRYELRRRNLDKSKTAYTEALAIAQEEGMFSLKWSALEGLGTVAEEEGQFQQGLEYLRKALKMVEAEWTSKEITSAKNRISQKIERMVSSLAG